MHDQLCSFYTGKAHAFGVEASGHKTGNYDIPCMPPGRPSMLSALQAAAAIPALPLLYPVSL